MDNHARAVPDAGITAAEALGISSVLNQPGRRIFVAEPDGERFTAYGEHAESVAAEADLTTEPCRFPDTGEETERLTVDRATLEQLIRLLTDRGLAVVSVEISDDATRSDLFPRG